MNTSPRQTRVDSLESFAYTLPRSRIATRALAKGEAKCLVYHEGTIHHISFLDLQKELTLWSKPALFVCNNSQVIAARLFFTTNGVTKEIFCLESVQGGNEYLFAKGNVEMRCFVGSLPQGASLESISDDVHLRATIEQKEATTSIVMFTWDTKHTFGEILDKYGVLPLPPYMKREAQASDEQDYQTVYATSAGSVAAPTAGLHFSREHMKVLEAQGHRFAFVTLHVGAGTFLTPKVAVLQEHEMHKESFYVSNDTLDALITHDGPVIGVGTTSLRVLESLRILGCKLNTHATNTSITSIANHVNQWEDASCSAKEAYALLRDYTKKNVKSGIDATTQLCISPGFDIDTIDALLTNFHVPKSTLLALVASCIGPDWKRVYEYAMHNDFRFLSYGDSSLLFLPQKTRQ